MMLDNGAGEGIRTLGPYLGKIGCSDIHIYDQLFISTQIIRTGSEHYREHADLAAAVQVPDRIANPRLSSKMALSRLSAIL
jgi:hypothetical protein